MTPYIHNPRFERVVDVVCQRLDLLRDDLYGRGRHPRVVLAREAIVHMARLHTAMSYPEIAAGLHKPNHSTTLTAHERFQRRFVERVSMPGFHGTRAALVDDLARSMRTPTEPVAPAQPQTQIPTPAAARPPTQPPAQPPAQPATPPRPSPARAPTVAAAPQTIRTKNASPPPTTPAPQRSRSRDGPGRATPISFTM